MARTHPVDREQLRAAVPAGLAGWVVLGGVLLAAGGPDAVGRYAAAAGLAGAVAGAAVLAVLAVALAVAFAPLLARAVDPYVNAVFSLSQRSDRVRKLLLPAVQRAALPVTALNVGVGYGLALGVLVHWLALPAAVTVAGGSGTVPAVDAAGLLAWLAYGAVAGGVYGLVFAR